VPRAEKGSKGLDVGESSSSSEQDIIRRVLLGERDEFRHLVALHQARVYAMVLRQVGEEYTARDLTQEAFVKAYRSLPSFRFESAFGTWLVRIALNLTNSYFSSRPYKERLRSIEWQGRHSEEQAVQSANPDWADEEIEQLQRAVAELPAHYREALVLCGFEQKSYAEAAEILGIPIGTVRSRLNKARLLVRQNFFKA
jgi:RNA polymerase sigma-70 factor, ECF subfamily